VFISRGSPNIFQHLSVLYWHIIKEFIRFFDVFSFQTENLSLALIWFRIETSPRKFVCSQILKHIKQGFKIISFVIITSREMSIYRSIYHCTYAPHLWWHYIWTIFYNILVIKLSCVQTFYPFLGNTEINQIEIVEVYGNRGANHHVSRFNISVNIIIVMNLF